MRNLMMSVVAAVLAVSLIPAPGAAALSASGQVLMAPAIGWANVQFPASMTVISGATSGVVYGQAWIDGVTYMPGPTPNLLAEVGYGPNGSDPAADPASWTWTAAAFNADVGSNDEFMGTLTVGSPAGEYDYAYRYSFHGPWVYADLDGTTNGYSADQAGDLIVEASGATGVPGPAPAVLRLYPNQPNPFNPSTMVRFELPEAGAVQLSIYDLRGRLVATLLDGIVPAGTREAIWTGRDSAGRAMASGSYLARLQVGGKLQTVRMSLVR